MIERYTVGTSPVPWWCKNKLSPYIKTNGKTGWEYYAAWRTHELKAGDKLIFDGFKVTVERR